VTQGTRQRHSDGLALLSYIALAVALTYPLALHLTTHVPGRGTDDPALTWNLWWLKFALFDLQATPLYSNYIYYPIGVNLVAYTSTFLNAVLALPLQFAFGVIPAQNLYTWGALVLSGYGALLLAREMLSRGRQPNDFAAALAGAFYAFGAWHLSYVAAGHFMLLSNQWIPFLALMLFRFERTNARGRAGFLAGLFFVCAAWTELTFIPFVSLLTGLYFVYVLLARRALLWDAARRRALVTNLATFVGVVALGVAPLALNLFFDTLRYGYYLAPGLGRVQIFSAELISYFVPSFQHPVLGAWANGITTANTSYAFIGWAALALALLGMVTAWKFPEARFWGALAFFFALALLGATLIVNGNDTGIPMPFALLRQLPFVNANRYPVRFNVMMMLALTPLVAFGAAWLTQTRGGKIALGALVALLAFEQLVVPLPLSDLRAGAVFDQIKNEPGDFTVMDLPLGWRNSVVIQGAIDFKAQFLQTLHQKRLLGGLTSRNPLFKFQYFREIPILNSIILLEEGSAIDDAQRAQDKTFANQILQFFDLRYVEVNRALTKPAVLEYVRAVFPLTEIFRDAERIVYRVDVPPLPQRATIDPAAETSRMLFDDRWGRAQEDNAGFGFRWATDTQARVWLPLGDANYQLTLRLRGAHPQQNIQLRVNGAHVADWNVSDAWGEYTAQIPARALRAGLDELVFVSDTTPLAQAAPDDRTIGGTGVVAPVDIAATGAGFEAGKFGEIYVAGQNRILSTRGYHLVAVNPQSGSVDAVGAFDTFADRNASQQLANFVAALPQGEIVAGVAIDEASNALTDKAFTALQTLGVAGDLRTQFRAGHAFVGIKGLAPGQAVEDMNAHFPANIAMGKNVSTERVSFALGPFEITQK
jgi:hypothetical protein